MDATIANQNCLEPLTAIADPEAALESKDNHLAHS
jgi:hypothetical protein